jgi:hypothetical protein
MKKAIKISLISILFLALVLFSCLKYFEWEFEKDKSMRLYEDNRKYEHKIDSFNIQINAYKDTLKMLRDQKE